MGLISIVELRASILLVIMSINLLAYSCYTPKEFKNSEVTKKLSYTEVYTTILECDDTVVNIALNLSKKYSVDRNLVFALIRVESNFDSNAVNYNKNGSVDRGLCQLNSNSFPELSNAQFFNEYVNISKSVEYMSFLLSMYNNDEKMAIYAYNCGFNRVNAGNVPNSTKGYFKKISAFRGNYAILSTFFIRSYNG